MATSNPVFDVLDASQLKKYLDALEVLRQRPNVWFSLSAIDGIIGAGPRLTDFGGSWLEELYKVFNRPRAQFAMRVEVHTVRRRPQPAPKYEAPDVTTFVKEELSEADADDSDVEAFGSAGAASVHVVACTALNDAQHPYVGLPPGRGCLMNALGPLLRPREVRGRVDIARTAVFLRFSAVTISSVAELLLATSESRRAGTAQIGVNTASLQATVEAQNAVQYAVSQGLVYYQAAFGAAARKRAAAARRGGPVRAAAGGDGAEGEHGDGDLAIGGGAGGLDDDDAALAHGMGIMDFDAWLKVAPVAIRHRRLIDGVVIDDPGLPSVFRPMDGESVISVTRKKATNTSDGGGMQRFQGDIRVSLILGDTKIVEIDPRVGVLKASQPNARIEFVIRASGLSSSNGKGEVQVKVRDVQSTLETTGHRTIGLQPVFTVPWERKKPVVLFHRATESDNLLVDHGLVEALRAPTRAGLPPITAARMLAPPPNFSAALARASVTAEDTKEMGKRLFTDAYNELKNRDRHLAADSSDASWSSEDDTAGAASGKAVYARYLDNRHMLPLGVDMRKPFKAAVDANRATYLVKVGSRTTRRKARSNGKP